MSRPFPRHYPRARRHMPVELSACSSSQSGHAPAAGTLEGSSRASWQSLSPEEEAYVAGFRRLSSVKAPKLRLSPWVWTLGSFKTLVEQSS